MKINYPTLRIEDQPDDVLLALLIWGEARGKREGESGKAAVASVVLNRIKAGMGKDIRSVILKPKQFSCLNAGDPNRDKMEKIKPVNPVYEQCYEIANRVLNGSIPDPTDGATHYWNPKVVTPGWSRKMEWTVKIGSHQFAKEKS